jgi:hypothetical protein
MPAVATVLGAITNVLAPILPVFAPIAHVLAPIPAIFAPIDPILDSIAHAVATVLGLSHRARAHYQRRRKGKQLHVQSHLFELLRLLRGMMGPPGCRRDRARRRRSIGRAVDSVR